VLKELLWLAVAGATGTLCRYGLSGLAQWIGQARFPWGTLAVNGLGCFLFGLIWVLAEQRLVIGGQTRAIVLIGFMGAFTTFSTYAFETGQLLRDSEWFLAAGNLLAHNAIGLLCVFLGFGTGRWL